MRLLATVTATRAPMMDLLDALRPLAIVLVGFGLMVGLLSPKRALGKLLRLILLPVILVFAGSFALACWHALPVPARVGLVVSGVPAALAYPLVRTRFGREVLASILGNFLYDVLRRLARRFGWILLGLVLIAVALSLWL